MPMEKKICLKDLVLLMKQLKQIQADAIWLLRKYKNNSHAKKG